MQAFDASGRPLRNIPITFEAPASGASGTFNLITGQYPYQPAPDPLRTTTSTDEGCNGTLPFLIANAIVGSYTVRATAPGVPPLLIAASNLPPEAPAFMYSG